MLSGLDATDANLTPLMRHGGKLLMAHGTVDQTVSTRATEIYYQRMLVTMGFGAVGSFARFYEIPGLQHAVGTEFNASWDSLTTLENWVEHGTPPAHQVVTDTEGVCGDARGRSASIRRGPAITARATSTARARSPACSEAGHGEACRPPHRRCGLTG
ncbi:hypothetical protein HDG33_003727 [Paraburkholderia sp. Cpub6]|nr:hypothetical protein [Paraburkholderia sp. Cpub6]